MASEKIKLDPILMNISTVSQQLGCPLLNGGEDWWINELFLLPGVHRLQLFDWIFSKFGFDVEAELSSQSKVEKDCLQILCAMGLCGKSDASLVEGSASKQKQLKFWKRLFDLLHMKMHLSSDLCNCDDRAYESSSIESQVGNHSDSLQADGCQIGEQQPENASQEEGSVQDNQSSSTQEPSKRCLEAEYLKCTSILTNIASNVNMSDLFVEKMSFFPPDVEKDVDHILSTNAGEVEKLPNLKNAKTTTGENSTCFTGPLVSSDDLSPTLLSEELKSIDCSKTDVITEFQVVEKEFRDVYKELKPVLRSSGKSFSDVGTRFEEAQPQMEFFSKLMSYLKVTKSTSSSLECESGHLQNFRLDDFDLTGSELEDYISILQELQDSSSRASINQTA